MRRCSIPPSVAFPSSSVQAAPKNELPLVSVRYRISVTLPAPAPAVPALIPRMRARNARPRRANRRANRHPPAARSTPALRRAPGPVPSPKRNRMRRSHQPRHRNCCNPRPIRRHGGRCYYTERVRRLPTLPPRPPRLPRRLRLGVRRRKISRSIHSEFRSAASIFVPVSTISVAMTPIRRGSRSRPYRAPG